MSESWEDLTLLALRLAKSLRTTNLHQVIRHIKHLRGERDTDPNSQLGRMIGSAFAALVHAGLLTPTTQGDFQISEAGLSLLDDPPRRIDLAFLSEIPEYVEYWKKANRDLQARSFQERRFEYYASGRTLFFQGAWRPALVLLAYTIEYHLKAGLLWPDLKLTASESKALSRGHNLPKLYDIGRKYGIFSDCRISARFLVYATDMFNLRYPSKEIEIASQRGGYSIWNSVIYSFDDCIMQLDKALAEIGADPTLSMGFTASGLSFPTPPAASITAFFHCNPFALARLDHFRELAAHHAGRKSVRLPTSAVEALAAEHIPFPGVSLSLIMRLPPLDLVAHFRIPRHGEPNPDPAAILLGRRTPCRSESEQVIDHLRQSFGDHRVTADREPRMGDLKAFVFCREATAWWRTLTIEKGSVLQWDLRVDRGRLDRWIEETRTRFERSVAAKADSTAERR